MATDVDLETRSFLHVGCGSKRKDRTVRPFAEDNWREVTLDIDEAVKADILDKLPELEKVPDNTFDAIYSAHNMEHLYAHEVPVAIAAFRRVLKDDGFILITCPDLQSVGERLAAGDVESPIYTSRAGPIAPLDLLYGWRKSIAAGNVYMAHKGGFTLKTLSDACRGGGFASTAGYRRPDCFDLWLLATKQQKSEAVLREMAATYLTPI